MSKGKFGVAILGCGGISGAHIRAYQQFPDECEIRAVCDINEAAAKRRSEECGGVKIYLDYREALQDRSIDIVSIPTPHYLHAPMTIAAAKAGKHILVEKPMAMTVGEAHEMIETARKHGVKLAVIFGRRTQPANRFIKERVIPLLGEIRFSYLNGFHWRGTDYYASGAWRGTWKYEGGGVFINQAVHGWDLYQWLLGGVDYAYGYWTNIMHPTIEVEDLGYGLIRFKNGSHGKLLTTSICKSPDGLAGIYIQGEKGEVRDTSFTLTDKSLEAELKEEMRRYVERPMLTGHAMQVKDLMDAIREDREPYVDGVSAMESLKMINGIHWHGWRFASDFRDWVYDNYADDLPKPSRQGGPIMPEDAQEQDWRGGRLIQDLEAIVTDESTTLEAPFLS